MRKDLVSCVAIVFFAGMAAVSLPNPLAMAIEDGIIAVVDNEVITAKDFQDYMRGIYAQLKIEGRSDKEIQDILGKYQTKGVEQLVEDRLILAEANRQGMSIRPKAIDDRFQEIRQRYQDPQEFLSEINREGITISDIRKKIEDQLKARYIVTKDVRDKIYVNPQDVTDFYNAHRQEFQRQARLYLASIFVKADGPSDMDAKKKIDAAWARLGAGEDFKAVAAVYSELPDIGEIADASLSPAFKTKTDAMSVGEMSGVLSMPEGFYILKLTGRTAPVEALLQDVKEEIYQELFEIKFKENFKVWIEKLRKKAYVDVRK